MATAYLSRTAGTPTNSKKNTLSVWVKRSAISTGTFFGGGSDANNMTFINFDTNERIFIQSSTSGSNTLVLTTNRKFRDPSAWMHIVVTTDTTLGTAGDRIKLYVNGVRETSFSTETQPSQNYDMEWNKNSQTIEIGKYLFQSGYSQFDGSMTHFHFIDGTSYDASTFGETDSTSGIWKPKTAPSVTYGNNGFFLKMENSGAMGTDSSGNSNTFTVNGTLTQNVDTPSNNFATLNVLQGTIATGYTIANGNLSTNGTSSNTWRSLPATLASSSGKFYWEIKVASFSYAMHFGIQDVDQAVQTDNYAYQYSRAYMYLNDGTKNNGGSGSSYGNSWTTNDIIGVALDMDNLKLYFSKNGVFQNSGDPTSGSTGTGSAFTLTSGYAYTPMFSSHSSSDKYQINFGQGYFGTTAVASAGTAPSEGGIFEYNCPSGYQALCTKGINSF